MTRCSNSGGGKKGTITVGRGTTTGTQNRNCGTGVAAANCTGSGGNGTDSSRDRHPASRLCGGADREVSVMARIFVEAYGCSASFADSEMISGIIRNGGHTLAEDPSQSDLNLIVTCSVKDATAKRMLHRIKSLGAADEPLVVAGCLPKAEPRTVQRAAGTASMMGPGSIGQTLSIVQSALGGIRTVDIADRQEPKVGLPKVRLNPAVGIIEIASGCMSECTFCQTKLAKGGLTSYRPGQIVRQAKSEVADGCKEIWLTSTDNGCYGLDIGTDLPELVDAVSDAIPDGCMIRVGMMNPMYMPKIRGRLLESLKSDKVYKFLHVPVQSGSDRVLREMARGHTADTFRRVVGEARRMFPDITISTDVIVGFPSETESEFEDTARLLWETTPDIVNLSKYSARPGTDAAERPDRVDPSEIKRRSRAMTGQVARISEESNRRWIGWRGPVLFDELTESGIRGRNHAYKPIYLADGAGGGGGGQEHLLGQWRTVRITGSGRNYLSGLIAA